MATLSTIQNDIDATGGIQTAAQSSVSEIEDGSNLHLPSYQGTILKKLFDGVTRFFHRAGPPPQECDICVGELPAASFHKGRICKRGEHKSTICINCLNTTVRLQMATKKWEALICPFCPSRLRFRVVGSYVEPCKSYQYKAFLYASKREWIEDFQWCTNPDCHYGQAHDISGLGNEMVCQACGFQTCAFHQMPWHHYGQTCKEFGTETNPYNLSGEALEKYQQEASEARVRGHSKRCPKCGVMIEKYGGCDSMYCSRCKHHFSWRKAHV